MRGSGFWVLASGFKGQGLLALGLGLQKRTPQHYRLVLYKPQALQTPYTRNPQPKHQRTTKANHESETPLC